MKKAAAAAVLAVFLAACSATRNEVDRGMALRTKILEGETCSFRADITADYGDKLFTFGMTCQGDSEGNLTFQVTEPESIAGITGAVENGTGKLTFDEMAVTFPLLADGQVIPVSAPWILLKTLRGGYLTAAGMEGDMLRLSIDDSYREDALHLDIWLDDRDIPVRGEILYGGRKILSLDVTEFEIG